MIKSRILGWAGHVAKMEEDRNAFTILTANPTGNIPLGRPRFRWDDNIAMDFKDIAINTRNWVDLAQVRDYCRAVVNAVLNLRIPLTMELVNPDIVSQERLG